jgi:peptidylprolyl isomerase
VPRLENRPVKCTPVATTLLLTLLLPCTGTPALPADEPPAERPLTMTEVLARAQPADWRALDPANTLYLELPAGRVVIELAPHFAPAHVDNVRTLVAQRYFDGLAILRSQDNYVVQWGDPQAGDDGQARSLGRARARLEGEYFRPAKDLPFTRLDADDAYAAEVGHSLGFPAGRDGPDGRAWLLHCYAMVGVGRDSAADSGNGSQLYVVIGHAPRHLDRNVTLIGRVVSGMERLSTLPRGTQALGFYASAEEQVPINSIRLASTVPAAERADLELLRTDTATFDALVQARRYRRESWFLDPAGHIGVCNVPLPVRERRP